MKTIFFFLLIIFNHVYLPILTKPYDQIELPNFLGKNETECLEIIKIKNLKVEFLESTFFQKKLPIGIVSDQCPKAGSLVKPKRVIYLTKNTKRDTYVLFPNIKGNTLRNAYVVLKNLDLELGKVVYVKDIANNCVLECFDDNKEEISPNQKIRNGTIVNLKVGLNNITSMIKVPKILKDIVPNVREYLLEMHLDLGEINYVESVYHTPGEVVSQNPLPMSKVIPGTKVSLTLAR